MQLNEVICASNDVLIKLCEIRYVVGIWFSRGKIPTVAVSFTYTYKQSLWKNPR